MFDLHHYQTAADLLGSTALAFQFMPGLRGAPVAHRIARSLRCDGAANLSKTFAGANASNTYVVWSIRFKRSALGGTQYLFSATNSGGAEDAVVLVSDKLRVYGNNAAGSVTNFRVDTDMLFRDVSAWYDLTVIYDSANVTAADRIRIYVNKVRVSVTITTSPTSSLALAIWGTSTATHRIGADGYSTAVAFFSGYVAEARSLDGVTAVVDGSAFSATDLITGQSVPKTYGGVYGANGFYLDVSDNSNTTSSTLGKDRSGNNNDWTPNGFSVTAGVGNDSLVDTPTPYGTDTGAGGEVRGNYAVLSPFAADIATPGGGSTFAMSEGNLKILAQQTAQWSSARSWFATPPTGKWRFQATVLGTTSGSIVHQVGVVRTDATNFASADPLGKIASGYAFNSFDGNKQNNNSSTAYGSSVTNGDVVDVLIDADNGTIEFAKNGSPLGTAFSGLAGVSFCPAGSVAGNGAAGLVFNFGQQPWAYSNATLGVSGFKALCTQNLPTPAVRKSADGFVSAVGTGANIESAIAALISGWSQNIQIYKNRANTQEWYVRFSDEANSEMHFDSTAAEGANTTLTSGDNYVGYAIRCGATYGVFSDEVSHTNGVATSTPHGLTSPTGKYLAIVKIVNTTGSWYVSHPGLTSGYNILLDTSAAQQNSTVYASIDGTNITIASSAPTGTYRVIAIAEIPGFSSLATHTGNAAADGPAPWLGFAPELSIQKNRGANESWRMYDKSRDPYNVATNQQNIDSDVGDLASANWLDLLSTGVKIRSTDASLNGSGATILHLAFAESPFKYAPAA